MSKFTSYRFVVFALIVLFSLLRTTANAQAFEFSKTNLIVKDLKKSAIWYKNNLGMSKKPKSYIPNKEIILLVGDYELKLTQGKNVITKPQIILPVGKKYIHGIDKIGFSTNRLDSLYEAMLASKQKIKTRLTMDKNLDCRYFVVKDFDGNELVLLESKTQNNKFTLKPSYVTIISSDYLYTIKWYVKNLKFVEMEVKNEDKIHFQNFLKRDDIVLEIIHLPFESLETTEFMTAGHDLASYEMIEFRENDSKAKPTLGLDNNGNHVFVRR